MIILLLFFFLSFFVLFFLFLFFSFCLLLLLVLYLFCFSFFDLFLFPHIFNSPSSLSTRKISKLKESGKEGQIMIKKEGRMKERKLSLLSFLLRRGRTISGEVQGECAEAPGSDTAFRCTLRHSAHHTGRGVLG